MSRRLTTEQFIEKAKLIHGKKYDYSLVDYTFWDSKINIICKVHGVFSQLGYNHLKGKGCPKCSVFRIANSRRLNTEKFISKAILIHGSKYSYKNSNYVDCNTPLEIFCNQHQIHFVQKPNLHFRTVGCPSCSKYTSIKKISLNNETFLKRCKDLYNNRFIYNNFYIKGDTLMEIVCPLHGIFYQKASEHLRGHSCQKCAGRYKTHHEWVEEARIIHGNKYEYLTEYKYSEGYLKIKCSNKKHSIFRQKANNHLQGQGCPECGLSKNKLETKLKEFLKKEYKKIIFQYMPEWLKTIKMGKQSLDICLLKYKIAIEYQGIQHFKPVEFFGGDLKFIENQERDERKRLLCEENGYKLFYFSYTAKDVPADYPHKVYTDEQELKQAIEDHIKTLK